MGKLWVVHSLLFLSWVLCFNLGQLDTAAHGGTKICGRVSKISSLLNHVIKTGKCIPSFPSWPQSRALGSQNLFDGQLLKATDRCRRSNNRGFCLLLFVLGCLPASLPEHLLRATNVRAKLLFELFFGCCFFIDWLLYIVLLHLFTTFILCKSPKEFSFRGPLSQWKFEKTKTTILFLRIDFHLPC